MPPLPSGQTARMKLPSISPVRPSAPQPRPCVSGNVSCPINEPAVPLAGAVAGRAKEKEKVVRAPKKRSMGSPVVWSVKGAENWEGEDVASSPAMMRDGRIVAARRRRHREARLPEGHVLSDILMLMIYGTKYLCRSCGKTASRYCCDYQVWVREEGNSSETTINVTDDEPEYVYMMPGSRVLMCKTLYLVVAALDSHISTTNQSPRTT